MPVGSGREDSSCRRIARLSRYELEFENDGSLDSGAWYKFIRTGLWRRYDFVAFLGEGTLLTRMNSLSSIVSFAQEHDAHFIASGHEKRRIPRRDMLRYNGGAGRKTAMDEFHNEMIAATFGVFCRDPEFRALYDAWPDEGAAETQNHVPDIWPSGALTHRAWLAMNRRDDTSGSWLSDRLRSARPWLRAAGRAFAHAHVAGANWAGANGTHGVSAPNEWIHVNGVRRRRNEVVDAIDRAGVHFHSVAEPEWFGCTVAHVMSRTLLERLTARLERYGMYDSLELPFAATALEIVWGFGPAWLGVEKWFTDGIHRVRKHFVTYRREDDPETLAWYINRYYRGRLCVAPRGEYIALRAVHTSLNGLWSQLPDEYRVGAVAS